ncbi:MAG: Xaa-Pro dipeptidase, partial [Deltaproteobacteria bacterium]
MKEAVKKLEHLIAEKGLEGVLLFSPENLFYLTGYRGDEGVLLVEKRGGKLLVDGRYFTQAKEEAEGVEVGLLKSWTKGIAEELLSRSLKRVGVEAHSLTLRQYQRISEEAEGVELVPIGEDLEGLRARKGPDEVEAIKGAIAISEEALKEVLPLLKPGVKEIEIALELEFRMRRAGSEGVPFPPIVASGPRAALPHATPTEKQIGAGEPVIVDFGAR